MSVCSRTNPIVEAVNSPLHRVASAGRSVFEKRSVMRGEHEYAATSEGSPRLFFYNSTFANNATYLAIYFGTALFIALNAVFALAFVDDLSRNEKIFEDQKHQLRTEPSRKAHLVF